MKLITILKYILYIFFGLHITSFITGPIAAYQIFGGFESQEFIDAIFYTLMHGITGVLICYHGARVMKSFEKVSFSFEKMSNSFQWIAYTLLLASVAYNIAIYYSTDLIDQAYWIETMANTFMVIILGVFFLAISQIIKKADYYKSQNDLTI